jgi:hypothetical protein
MEMERQWGNLKLIKSKMARRWAKAARWSVIFELSASVFLITALLVVVHLIHFSETFHSDLLERFPSSTLYYLSSLGLYAACEYLVPTLLMVGSSGLTSQARRIIDSTMLFYKDL